MMMVNKLLYKVGENKENYSRLLVNKWGNEKWISKFFEKHLENIFPTLELFVFEKNGKKTTEWWGFRKERPDAICWYPQEKSFIIFEYKKWEYQRQDWLEQINRYLAIVDDEDKRKKLLEILNGHYPREDKLWSIDDINWKNLKIVWTAPKLLDKRPKEDEKIIWTLSEWYKSESENAVVLKSENKFFTELIGTKTNLPKTIPVRDKEIIENWELSEELIEMTKTAEYLWRKGWMVEIEKWTNLKKAKPNSWQHQKLSWKNHFCCLCGGGGYKEKFRMYPWPDTHYWIFLDLIKGRIKITGENLKENIESIDKPMICRECFYLKIYKKLW